MLPHPGEGFCDGRERPVAQLAARLRSAIGAVSRAFAGSVLFCASFANALGGMLFRKSWIISTIETLGNLQKALCQYDRETQVEPDPSSSSLSLPQGSVKRCVWY